MSTVKGRPFHPNHCNTQSCRLRRQWWHRVNIRIPKEGKETWKGLDQIRTHTQTPCLVSEAWGNDVNYKGSEQPCPHSLAVCSSGGLGSDQTPTHCLWLSLADVPCSWHLRLPGSLLRSSLCTHRCLCFPLRGCRRVSSAFQAFLCNLWLPTWLFNS